MACSAEQLKSELVVNCGASTKEQMKQHLRSLQQNAYFKVRLVNCNHFKRCFLDNSRNYIGKTFDAVKNNAEIEILQLSNEFTKKHWISASSNSKDTIINISQLKSMKGLKTLIIDNDDWDPEFFKNLQRYLTDSDCTIETLELKRGITAEEERELKSCFESAPTLRHYIGACAEKLQTVLDAKAVAGHEVACRP